MHPFTKYYKFTQYRRQYLICNFLQPKIFYVIKFNFFNIALVKEDFKNLFHPFSSLFYPRRLYNLIKFKVIGLLWLQ